MASSAKRGPEKELYGPLVRHLHLQGWPVVMGACDGRKFTLPRVLQDVDLCAVRWGKSGPDVLAVEVKRGEDGGAARSAVAQALAYKWVAPLVAIATEATLHGHRPLPQLAKHLASLGLGYLCVDRKGPVREELAPRVTSALDADLRDAAILRLMAESELLKPMGSNGGWRVHAKAALDGELPITAERRPWRYHVHPLGFPVQVELLCSDVHTSPHASVWIEGRPVLKQVFKTDPDDALVAAITKGGLDLAIFPRMSRFAPKKDGDGPREEAPREFGSDVAKCWREARKYFAAGADRRWAPRLRAAVPLYDERAVPRSAAEAEARLAPALKRLRPCFGALWSRVREVKPPI